MPEYLRPDIQEILKQLEDCPSIKSVKMIASAVNNVKFNPGIFKEFTYFLEEWETRKGQQLPNDIREKLYAQTK